MKYALAEAGTAGCSRSNRMTARRFGAPKKKFDD